VRIWEPTLIHLGGRLLKKYPKVALYVPFSLTQNENEFREELQQAYLHTLPRVDLSNAFLFFEMHIVINQTVCSKKLNNA
jgi:hypothetical protein